MASWCDTEKLFDPSDYQRTAAESSTWLRHDIFQRVLDNPESSLWIVKNATNDDNDDGWPDFDVVGFPRVEVWEMKFDTLEAALEYAGVTRRGAYGQPVEVYLYGDLDSGRLPVTESNRRELLDRYGKVG